MGDTFTIIPYGSKSGTFTTTNFPALSDGKQWKITYNATSVVLSVEIPVPEINVKQGTTNIADGTGSYDFGSVKTDTNKAVTFTIENLGAGPLNLTGTPKVQISGPMRGDFSVTTQPTTPDCSRQHQHLCDYLYPGSSRNAHCHGHHCQQRFG